MSKYPGDLLPLAKCGKVIGGGTPSKKRSDYWDGNIPWISAKEMKRFRLFDSNLKITELGLKESSAKIVPPNSVIFVVRGSILFRRVPVAVNAVPCTINQDMKAIVPDDGILGEYLAYMMLGCNNLLMDMVDIAGNSAGKLPTARWSSLKIRVPDPTEQRRIVLRIESLLGRVELIREEMAKAEAELTSFAPALLAKAFRGEL